MKIPSGFKVLFTALLLPLPLPVAAQNSAPIGIVIVAKGTAEARLSSGMVRPLTRRAEVFEGDTILVSAGAFAQIRMIDEALIALGSDTEFSLNRYGYDGDPATPDQTAMVLTRGCIMTITGAIGDAQSDQYQLDTPVASIGITGTVYSAVLAGDILYAGTYEGGTRVTNNLGSVALGIGGAYDFSRTLPGSAPEGLVDKPAGLDCQTSGFTGAEDQVTDSLILSPAPSRPGAVRPGP